MSSPSTLYRFASAAPDESIVHGACRPEHHRHAPPYDSVADWLAFMEDQGIERVCCLLDDDQLGFYDDLVGDYRAHFGDANVCHAPITDFKAVDEATLCETILPFLEAADRDGAQTVVHCSAGSGRTGHILVLWLACVRDYDIESALASVRETGREPLEGATRDQLDELHDACSDRC